jgi:hypothetical protein
MRARGPRKAQPSRGPVRLLAASVAALAVAVAAMTSGAAQARPVRSTSASRSAAAGATCVVHSLPSFVAQGELALTAMAADIVEVECNPNVYGTGSKIRITASQLFSRCKEKLTWYVPSPYEKVPNARGVTVALDADGNATVALVAGPECEAGESLVTAHMEEEPFESFTTSFTVLPPISTTPGVFALPAAQVEDARSSAVATIIEAEFPGGSEKKVRIASEELYQRCRRGKHLHWIRMDGTEAEEVPEVTGVELDNNGNAFVIAIGDSSCAEGPSLIEADLESKPFTTFTTTFTVQPPQPTEEPSFTIEKRQEVMGSGSGFTTSPLTGSVGQTVDYEIVVKNTANVAETFSEFADTHCDPGTIAGGPGSSLVAAGQSTTYTCDHALTAVGSYTNEASVSGTSAGGTPVKHTSNQVVVEVPPERAFTIEKQQEIMGSASGFTTSSLTGAIGQTVEYQIVVKNTGNEALTFSSFTDAHCDPGTIAGGPGEAPVAPSSSTTYTCSHVLASVGSYVNEASVTGTAQGEPPLTHTSNQVEVIVPTGPGPAKAEPGTVTPQTIPGPPNQPPTIEVLPSPPLCILPQPVLRGASGPKRGTFTLQISSLGIKQITFYLDGRKLKTLQHSQAKGGKFTIKIDPRKLSYGAHKVSIKTLMSNPNCALISRSGVFVRPHAQRVVLRFTG